MRRDEATLLDMVQAGRRIASFVDGVDEVTFIANAEKHWAVVAQLLIIGEAATRLSKAFIAAHPEIEWAKIIGMRNRLIHGYDAIRWDVVWRTATDAVPKLVAQLELLLPPSD